MEGQRKTYLHEQNELERAKKKTILEVWFFRLLRSREGEWEIGENGIGDGKI
jgi:hypothetical protein